MTTKKVLAIIAKDAPGKMGYGGIEIIRNAFGGPKIGRQIDKFVNAALKRYRKYFPNVRFPQIHNDGYAQTCALEILQDEPNLFAKFVSIHGHQVAVDLIAKMLCTKEVMTLRWINDHRSQHDAAEYNSAGSVVQPSLPADDGFSPSIRLDRNDKRIVANQDAVLDTVLRTPTFAGSYELVDHDLQANGRHTVFRAPSYDEEEDPLWRKSRPRREYGDDWRRYRP